MKCKACGMEFESGHFCPYCGVKVEDVLEENIKTEDAESANTNFKTERETNKKGNGRKPVKRSTAAILAILLGTFGVHKFYLHRIIQGIIYLLFNLTGIPTVLGIIEGIIYLCMGEERFNNKYNNPDYTRPKWVKICMYSFVGLFVLMIIWSCISIYNDGKIDRLIDAGKYEEAQVLLDKEDNTTKISHKRYAKLYAAQGMYDEAVTELLDYCKYEDILDVDSEIVKLMESYSKNASDDVRILVNEFSEKYLAAQEENSKLEQAKAEAEAAKSEADKSKAEAEAAKSEADKSKAEAEAAKSEADKSKEEAEAAKSEADKSKAEAEAAKSEADKSKEEAEAAKNEADKSKAEADKNNAEATEKSDTSNSFPSKNTIQENANYDFDYKTAMRYGEKYSNDYVVLQMLLGSEVKNSKNSEYSASIIIPDESYIEGFRVDWDEEFIILDKRKDKSRNWLEDDCIVIYGKFTGIDSDTFSSTNPYTYKTEKIRVPVIEVYYDELIEY